MPSILFVCTGNRYRSPLAAAVFRNCLEKTPDQAAWQVASAGTWTEAGQPADPRAVREARRLGLDLSSHASRQVDASLIAQSNLVVVMEANQKEALQVEFPAKQRKIYLLAEIIGEISYDILDTFEREKEISQENAREISDLISRGFEKIYTLAKKMAAQTNHP